MITYTLGDIEVETYAGPGQGAQIIKASEWEPVTRIMPHSEFPSASACLCQVTLRCLSHLPGKGAVPGRGPIPSGYCCRFMR